MRWLLMLCSVMAFPAFAVYQPTDQEKKLLNDVVAGTEQSLKYALPLAGKAEICRNYLENYRIEHPQYNYARMSSYLAYWIIIQEYTSSALTITSRVLPQLYYYQQKLYEKYGKYPKSSEGVKQLFEQAKSANYMKLNDYMEISQTFKENLRKKDLSVICMKALDADLNKIRERASATSSVDKLFFPGFMPRGKEIAVNAMLRDIDMLLWQIRDSYY